MEEASRRFQIARDAARTSGLAIGVLPDRSQENGWVELLIRTHLPAENHKSNYDNGRDPRSRNWIEIRTCDVVVALPGGKGTEAEINLAWVHGTPIILFGWSSSPLGRLGIPTSSNLVKETQMPVAVQNFISAHTTQPAPPGRLWPKLPSWPDDEYWPSPPPPP
jgi:hypothetical protein